jgi:D-alanyl-D-alanine dipeptidase
MSPPPSTRSRRDARRHDSAPPVAPVLSFARHRIKDCERLSQGDSVAMVAAHGFRDILTADLPPVVVSPDMRLRARAYSHVPIDEKAHGATSGLVDLIDYGVAGFNYYFSEANPPYFHRAPGAIPDLLARPRVAEMLAAINAEIAAAGLELFVFDAYRPVAVQAYFHDVWVPSFLRTRHPDKSDDWIRAETRKFWAPPAHAAQLAVAPPPHSTGGAVDLTLRFIETKMLLEMGGAFDDVTERSHPDFYEDASTGEGFTVAQARQNRRLLRSLMSRRGFVGHPNEWWHFSFGDQMWAALSGQPAALYGYAGEMLLPRDIST